jgi:hypothetical protein
VSETGNVKSKDLTLWGADYGALTIASEKGNVKSKDLTEWGSESAMKS